MGLVRTTLSILWPLGALPSFGSRRICVDSCVGCRRRLGVGLKPLLVHPLQSIQESPICAGCVKVYYLQDVCCPMQRGPPHQQRTELEATIWLY